MKQLSWAKSWSEWQDLNLRPPRPERGALPTHGQDFRLLVNQWSAFRRRAPLCVSIRMSRVNGTRCRQNPAVEDGAIMVGRLTDAASYRIVGWSFRLRRTGYDQQGVQTY